MMDPDSELKRLEREFPKSSRAWTKETSTDLDEKILSLAARHAPYLEAQYQIKCKLEERKPKGRTYIPESSITPSGVSKSEPPEMSQYSFDNAFFRSSSASESRREIPLSPPGAEKLLIMLRNAPEQEWLERISTIVQLGDVDLAIYLLRKYKSKFLG